MLAFGDATTGQGMPGADARAGEVAEVERRAETRAASSDAPLMEALAESAPALNTLPRLQWSADEARMVAAFGQNSVVRLGRDATPDALNTAPLDSFSVVHFATHAVVDEQMPARSALVLSDNAGRSGLVDAGSLEGRRISPLPSSCCSSPVGLLAVHW